MNPRPLKAKRMTKPQGKRTVKMWGDFNREGALQDVFKTRQAAGWVIDGVWQATFAGRYIRPVLVTYPTPKRKRKAKGA